MNVWMLVELIIMRVWQPDHHHQGQNPIAIPASPSLCPNWVAATHHIGWS